MNGVELNVNRTILLNGSGAMITNDTQGFLMTIDGQIGGGAADVEGAGAVVELGEGGGDGFASGLAYGFMEGKGPQAAVEYGAAHGALAMTTPGDTSMVNVKEVEAVMKGKGAHVIR